MKYVMNNSYCSGIYSKLLRHLPTGNDGVTDTIQSFTGNYSKQTCCILYIMLKVF